MFNIGFSELVIILLVAFLVVGPDKLPNLAKGIASGIREFKSAISNVKEDLKVDEHVKDLKDKVSDFKEANPDLTGVVDELKSAKESLSNLKTEINPLKSEIDNISREVHDIKDSVTAPLSDVKKEVEEFTKM